MSGITGHGAHVFLIDDPFKNRESADSAALRNRVWREYLSTVYTRLMPKGAIVIIMTRWNKDDLVARALPTDDWTRVKLPGILNEGTGEEQALWPEWFPLEEMRAKREMYTKANRLRDWTSLYQQEPTTEEGTYMRREWLEDRYEEIPRGVRYYLASDFAVKEPKEGDDADATEHGVFAVAPDHTIYVVDWWQGRTTADVWIDARLDLVRKYKPVAVFGEGGVIRHAVQPFLFKRQQERRIYCVNEWINPISDKATRGRAFQARAAMGKIRFPKQSAWAERVIDQCVDFPAGAHDDAFDVISLMCLAIDQANPAYFTPPKTERKLSARYRPVTRLDSWRTI
jgi:predicted phage terminase large subunit-like protein